MHWHEASFLRRSASFRKSSASQMTCSALVVDSEENLERCLPGPSHLLAHLLPTSPVSGGLVSFIWRLSGLKGHILLSSLLDLCLQGRVQAGASGFVFAASMKPGLVSALFTWCPSAESLAQPVPGDWNMSGTGQEEYMSSCWLRTVSSW